jgi:hypothetical protein
MNENKKPIQTPKPPSTPQKPEKAIMNLILFHLLQRKLHHQKNNSFIFIKNNAPIGALFFFTHHSLILSFRNIYVVY